MIHSSPNLPKKRCSEDIKHRIELLQALGCCLDDGTTTGLERTPQQHRHSFANAKNSCKSINSDNSSHRRSLRTSVQLPLTPCLDDDDDTNLEASNPQPSQRRSTVSFADMTDVCFIPGLDDDTVDCDELYYNETQIANMRHEAFLEKVGLTHMIA